MNNLFTSSKTSEWSTPDWLYKQLDEEFHFQLDAACTEQNQKCRWGYGIDLPLHQVNDHGTWKHCGENALFVSWYDPIAGEDIKSIWCNPPYNNLGEWIEQGWRASQLGCTVVFLLPTTKTDQPWWHSRVLKDAAEIRFIEGRVKFGGMKSAAPFPSCVVIFKPKSIDWKLASMKQVK